MNTIDYYDNHANQFIQSTFKVDMEVLYQSFLEHLPDNAFILDLGCGSGRDCIAFKNKGYNLDAIDYSEELVKQATELTGIPVRYESFYDLTECNKYDGVWACASLLHCDRDKLPDVLNRIFRALRCTGVCYMSFKYGKTDREKDGRKFTDLNEEQAEVLLNQFHQIDLIKYWVTIDQRPDREEKWLNILVKKKS